MRRTISVFLLFAVTVVAAWVCGPASAAIYKYVDDEGVLHIVTSIEDVPAKYRDQVQKMESDPAPSGSSQPAAAGAPAVPADAQPASVDLEQLEALRRLGYAE